MKRVQRPMLPSRVAQYLDRQQQRIDQEQLTGTLDMEAFWKSCVFRRT